ncbi:MAG TPA: YceI family protein [Chryseosolibacter sp.]
MTRSLFVALFLASTASVAQKFTVEKSNVVFFSDALIEDITATNKKASGIFNSDNGDIVFSIPVNAFKFAKALMQEHFNEKYMESDKFPKATFQGNVQGYDKTKTGLQSAKAVGKMTIHGVTREVEIPGTITRQGSKLQFNTKFMVKLADYNIAIPQLLLQNIAEQVEVTADFAFKPQ